MKQAQEQNLFQTTCVQMVRDAAEILEEMASEQKPKDDRSTPASGWALFQNPSPLRGEAG
jgi:hypothetical protein